MQYNSWLSASNEYKQPRYCVLRKWSALEGYGFNLQTKSDQDKCYISEIDIGSPSDHVKLRPLDVIIEVNKTPIKGYSHKDIVTLIQYNPDEVSLLVADQRTLDYYCDKNCTISRESNDIIKHICPISRPGEINI